MRRLAALLLVAVPAGCAALVDWGSLSDGHGADGHGDASPSSDGSTAEGASGDAGGTQDAGSDAPDPCSGVVGCSLCNGYYCGRTNQSGFAGGAPNTVYLCIDGSTAMTTTCQQGDCIVSTSGYPDCCDLCTGYQDGTYCGSTLGYPTGGYASALTELQNVVFTCEGGVSAAPERPCGPERCAQQGTTAVCTGN